MPNSELPRFDELIPAIPGEGFGKDAPVWVSVAFKGLMWTFAIVFFPVTLCLIWGYRTRRFTWGLGGHGFSTEDE